MEKLVLNYRPLWHNIQMTISYPYLPVGKTIMYVSADNPFMKVAELVRNTLSTELNHPTGAVVVIDGTIVGRGANQAHIKNKAVQKIHRKYFCVRRLFNIPSGQKYWLCPGCARTKDHAEVRAVRDALACRANFRSADLYLFGHWWCCKSCWDAMIDVGINTVYLLQGSEKLFNPARTENSITER